MTPPAPDEQTPGPADPGVPQTTLDRLENLSDQLDRVTARLSAVAGQATRTRRLAWGLIVSLALDVVLTILIAALSVTAIHANAARARNLQESQLTACAIGNQARTDQITLWGYVIRLSANGPNANKRELHAFQQFIDTTFAQIDCAKVYGKP